MTASPCTGGTIERPGNLYPPGVGDCPECGQQDLPTVAGGRITAHGPTRLWGDQGTVPRTRTRTCPGWGAQAVQR